MRTSAPTYIRGTWIAGNYKTVYGSKRVPFYLKDKIILHFTSFIYIFIIAVDVTFYPIQFNTNLSYIFMFIITKDKNSFGTTI